MLLKSLSMYGFKSFADKLHIDFGAGTTAIIGPNGCGKSNVIDAIRWVFGEQKASALRSGNMQDVIFSGTQKRQPLGLAEVTLTIENSKGILPIDYAQVAITRRIHRSGESEYLVNRVPGRLRDIQNLFMDTGIGSSAYTTIENNMINQILSDKAEERRMLFDEAAGIGKYKHRRKESQRQLERTTQDLLRINDKVQEADRQVRMLARHVEKARRYKQYFDDLKSLEVGYENGRFLHLGEQLEQRRQQLEELNTQVELLRGRLSSSETDIEKRELQAMEKEDLLQIASRNVSDAGDKVNDIDRDISVTIERRKALEDKIARFGQEMETLVSQVEEKTHLKLQIEKSSIERETKKEECTQRVVGAHDELAAFDAGVALARGKADMLSQEQIECINNLSDKRNELSNLQANLNNAFERLHQYEREVGTLEARVDEYLESNRKCREQLASSSDAVQRLMQSRETLLARIEKEDKSYQSFVEREKHCEATIDSCKTQLKFLAGLDAAFEGYDAGVKSLLTAQRRGVRGIVADCITVTNPAMTALVEKALGSAVQTVVFETDADIRDAAAYLDSEKAGTACMVSLERMTRVSRTVAQRPAGVGDALRDCVSIAADMTVLADNLLCGAFVVDTANEAMEKALVLDGAGMVLSRDGVLCSSDGTVEAGSAKAENVGLLQRRSQTEELKTKMGRLESELQVLVHDKEICIINRDEAKFALVEVDEKMARSRQMQQEQETSIRHNETEIQNTIGRITEVQKETEQLRERIREHENGIASCDAELGARQSRLSELEEQVGKARERQSTMDIERRQLAEHLKNVELEMHGLTNRINQDRSDIERLGREVGDYTNRRGSLLREQQQASVEMQNLTERVESLKEQLERQKLSREELQKVMDEAREEYNGILNGIDEIRKGNKTVQSELEQQTGRIHEIDIHQTRDEQEQRRIRERIFEAYEIDLVSPNEPLPLIDQEDAEVSENIQVLRERIRRVGQVNMAALEDFDSESARLKDLTRQRDDLQTAVTDLEKAIRKLDKEAREQFIATFELVRQNFANMFLTLFEGGEASLSLEEGVDPLIAPIHINVRPAGKKMRGVQLLSGGERALTAIALLFGLYQVKPSAYCILDELDAPLDDANVGRFVRLVKQFAEKTQFIIVTHNKRTMEAADILYGVTQQEKGVSQIVSVKFDDALLEAA